MIQANKTLAGGFNLHDYARAQIWKPFYDMYQWGCQQMKRDYEAGQETLEAIDREASEDNPPVIRDYLAASDEEKGVFEVGFQTRRVETKLILLPSDHHPQFEAKCTPYRSGEVVHLEANVGIANPTHHGSPY